MLNRVTIMGRLGKDPELKYTQSGVAVTSFSLAVDRDFTDKQTGERATDWIDVTCWRQTAEFVCKYFGKGRVVAVDGRLQTRRWKDRDGNNRTSVEVLAESVYFGDSKREETGEYGAGSNSYQGNYEAPANLGGFSEIADEGALPF